MPSNVSKPIACCTTYNAYSALARATFPEPDDVDVCAAETNQVFFCSDQIKKPSVHTDVYLANLTDGSQTKLNPPVPLPYVNGAVPYNGQLLLAVRSSSPELDTTGLIYFNPTNGSWSWALNSFLGLHFNGPNDITALSDGGVIFTDPDYGFDFGLAPPQQIANYVWYWQPGKIPRPLIWGLAKPNGVVVSADQKTLYVSDSGAIYGGAGGAYNATLPRQVYAFDLITVDGGVFASNQRLFAIVDNGIPDGLKLDVAGNLYTSSSDGVQVFSPAGQLIGKILLPITEAGAAAVSNFVFAGNQLVILHRNDVVVLPLNTSGIDYAYA